MGMARVIEVCKRHAVAPSGVVTLLLSLVISTGVMLHGCSAKPCALTFCETNALDLFMEAPGGMLSPGSYALWIDADGERMTCSITVTGDPGDPNGGITGMCDRDLSNTAAPCTLYKPGTLYWPGGLGPSDGCWSLSVKLGTAPEGFGFGHTGAIALLSIHVEREGTVLLDTSVEPHYIDGGECAPGCSNVWIRLKLQ